jgi:hypothetical protein
VWRHDPASGNVVDAPSWRTVLSLRFPGYPRRPISGPHERARSEAGRPPRAYRASDTYAVAERVVHPRFGEGVVERVEEGKATVRFPSDRRVLACGREKG